MIGSNATVSIKRLQRAIDRKETYVDHLEDLECYVEQVSPDKAQAIDGSAMFRVYRFIFDAAVDIQENDKIIDESSREYSVKGPQHFDGNTDIENHSEIIALRNNARVTA